MAKSVAYGDPTAANQFVAIAGGDRGYTLLQVFRESPGLILSLVAVFGWFNLQPPGMGLLGLGRSVGGGRVERLCPAGGCGVLSCRTHPLPQMMTTAAG
ncbi:MAG: hypothetical protein R3C44_11465 [Chloroflexota bacterium]